MQSIGPELSSVAMNPVPQAAAALHSKLIDAAGAATKLSHREVMKSLDFLVEDLRSLPRVSSVAPWTSLADGVHHFAESYDRFLDARVPSNTVDMALQANYVYPLYEQSVASMRYWLEATEPQVVRAKGETSFTVVLYDTDDLDVVARKLGDLVALYRSLCKLCGIVAEEHPLRLAHAETGSLLVTLLGSSAVAAVVVWLLSEVSAFIKRSSPEARAQLVKTHLETVMLAASLDQKLRDIGINTAPLQSELQQQIPDIARRLASLNDGKAVHVKEEGVRASDGVAALGHPDVPLLESRPTGKRAD
jgi:hypothetical protein